MTHEGPHNRVDFQGKTFTLDLSERMAKAFLVLIVAFIGIGGWWFLSNSVPSESSEAKAQADAFVANLYATSTLSAQTASAAEASSESVRSGTMPAITSDQKIMNATLHTNQGDITIEFFDADAPNTVANFIKLAGAGFYNGTKFHRVIAGFMIQGGDPLSKDESQEARWGTGGPGYRFEDEIHANNKNAIGTIAMANSGPNTNGSQFFINVANNNFLDPKHTVFGRVTDGMDVVEKIQNTQTGANDRPLSPVVIESITLK